MLGDGMVDAFAKAGSMVGIISATTSWMLIFGMFGSSTAQPLLMSRGLIDSISSAPVARSVGMTSSLKTRIDSVSLTVMLGMNSRTIPSRLPARVLACAKSSSGSFGV